MRRERKRGERGVKAQNERGRQEREAEAQGGKRERWMRKKSAKKKKVHANSLHEESHVSNRHMTWWQDAR